jgi:ankyrin repeat protein
MKIFKIFIFISVVISFFTSINANNNDENKDKTLYKSLQRLCRKSGDKVEEVKKLLKEYDTIPDLKLKLNKEKDISLLLVALKSSNFKISQLLVNKNINLHEKNIDGYTPLMVISLTEGDHIYLAQSMINKDESIIHEVSEDGVTTSLYFSIMQNNLDISRLLIERGADTNIVGYQGLSVLHLSVMLSGDQVDIVNSLLDNNADGFLKCDKNNTALHYAILRGNLNVVKLLINEKGFDKDSRGQRNLSPIMLLSISQGDRSDIVKFLIEKGADISLVDDNNNAAFRYADTSKNSKIKELLLARAVFEAEEIVKTREIHEEDEEDD